MTEVAPHAGRRARRQAEAWLPSGDTPATHSPYGAVPASYGPHAGPSGSRPAAGGPAGAAPDTALFSPATTGDYGDATRGHAEPHTGYLPSATAERVRDWHADADAFAPRSGYAPTDDAPTSAGAPAGYGAPEARAGSAPGGYAAPAPAAPPSATQPAPHGRVYTPPSHATLSARPSSSASAAPVAPDDPSAPPRPRAQVPGGPSGPGGPEGPWRRGGDGDDFDGGMRGRHATGWGQGFEGLIAWTLLGSLIPGSGLVAAGRRVAGWSVVALWVGLGLGGVALVLTTDPVEFAARELLARPERLRYIAYAVIALSVLWGLHVIATNLSLRRFTSLTGLQSALSWMLVTVLAGGGVAAAVQQVQKLTLTEDTINSVFSDGGALSGSKHPDASKADPWANTPRVNILLIGSDAGADRTGIRTDTLIVASINTKTGNLVTISIPRNLEHVPFPPDSPQAADYPNGFYCAQDACMINALWQFGVEHKDQYYKGVKNPGLKATVDGVEQALGLKIDDYAMVNLRGFMQFVDAIGGLELNVKRRIPVGGHHDAAGREVGVTSYIEPGRQMLDGYHSLWFARSRSDSDDFERMRRQRCVIAALVKQAEPQKVALNITEILNAAKQNIRTSIPVSDLNAWVTLAMRVKRGHMTSLPLTNSVISPGDPDFDKIHGLVEDALTKTPTTAKAGSTATASPSPTTPAKKKKPKPTATVHETGDAVDVNAVC